MKLASISRDRDFASIPTKIVKRDSQAEFHVDQNTSDCCYGTGKPKYEGDSDAISILYNPRSRGEDACALRQDTRVSFRLEVGNSAMTYQSCDWL